MPVLTEADIAARWKKPLRNFTPEQWGGIVAKLPASATPLPQALFEFLLAANLYWEAAAGPTPRKRAKLVAEAIEHIYAAIDKGGRGAPRLRDRLARLSDPVTELVHLHDALQQLVARCPLEGRASVFADPRFHRQEFVSAALDLWLACGGDRAFSRTPAGKPAGPLIRYLDFVCGVVMGARAPKPNTLASWVQGDRASGGWKKR